MKNRGMSKSNLFFLECIVSIVMFALASLVILQALLKVEETRIRSQEEMQALVVMCTIAEHIQAEKAEMPERMSWHYNEQGDMIRGGEVPHFVVELTKQEERYGGGVLQNYELKGYSIFQSQKHLVGNINFTCYGSEEIQLKERGERIEK